MATPFTLVRAAAILHEGLQEATGMLLRDGLVVAIGDADELRRQEPDARLEDFGGATITPGLIDGHMHPVWGVQMARGVDLSQCRSMAEVREALRAEEATLAPGEWLHGWGFEPILLDGAPVTNDFVHEAVGAERPAYLTLFDAHSAIISDAGLREVGIVAPETFLDGAAIVAREGSDQPSGHLLEFTAMEVATRCIPRESVPAQAAKLERLLLDMARTGLTGAYVPDAQNPDVVAILEEIERTGDLPMRLRISPWCTPLMTDDEVEQLAAALGRRGRRWELTGVKLFIDGTIDGGTAWLESPDTLGEGERGFWHEPARYARNVQRLHELGIPTITHAIGDRGVRFVAETLAALPHNGTQHRIDHLELVADDVITAIGRDGLSICVQPSHCTHFMRADGSDVWSQRLGAPRNTQGWKTRAYLEAGVVEALGSDWPVAPFDPREIIADAQLRHRHDGEPVPIHPEQALTAAEAVLGYTERVPESVGLGGSALAPGTAADFTVWAANPVAAAPHDVAVMPIVATAIDGRLVFDTRTN